MKSMTTWFSVKSLTTWFSMIVIALISTPALLPGRLMDSGSVTAARSQTVPQPVCIGFDKFPDGSDVTTTGQTAREITTQYGSLGVKFSAGTGQKVVAVRDLSYQQRAISPPNAGQAQGPPYTVARMTAEFFDPATGTPAVTDFVSITTAKVKGSTTPREFKAFDVTGSEAASTQVDFTRTQQTINFAGPAPAIHNVTLDMASSDFFDNFCFGLLEPAASRSLIVDTTSDVADGNTSSIAALTSNQGPDGVISLREAITAANNTPGIDEILFDIPKTDRGFNGTVWTISPSRELPPLTDGYTYLDGGGQTRAQGNTNRAGPEVVINGSSAGAADGLRITSNGNVVYSLAVTGFSGNGILIAAGGSNNRIGALNVISGNQGAGIAVVSFNARGNRLCGNSIFDNGGMGIDLRADGVTVNDPGDADDGANRLMNYPEITLAKTYKLQLPNGAWSYNTVVQGTIDTPNPGAVRINVFFNEQADPSGWGEGKTYAGSAVPDASGKWSVSVPEYFGPYITATATDAEGNTSEFCPDKQVVEQLGGIAVLNGGETWTPGSTVTIRWVSSGIPPDSQVKIELLSVDASAMESPELRDMSPAEFLRIISFPCGAPPMTQSSFGTFGCSQSELVGQGPTKRTSPLAKVEPIVEDAANTGQVQWMLGPRSRPAFPLLQETIIERTANTGQVQWTVQGARARPGILAAVRITPLGELYDQLDLLAVIDQWVVLSPPADLPDLVPKNLQGPLAVARGSITLVSFNIVNEGGAVAGPATHEIHLLAKRDVPGGLAVDVDVLLGTVTTGPLAAGASAFFQVMVLIPGDVVPGVGTIRIVADAGNAVNESNEDNNTAEVPIMITGF